MYDQLCDLIVDIARELNEDEEIELRPGHAESRPVRQGRQVSPVPGRVPETAA